MIAETSPCPSPFHAPPPPMWFALEMTRHLDRRGCPSETSRVRLLGRLQIERPTSTHLGREAPLTRLPPPPHPCLSMLSRCSSTGTEHGNRRNRPCCPMTAPDPKERDRGTTMVSTYKHTRTASWRHRSLPTRFGEIKDHLQPILHIFDDATERSRPPADHRHVVHPPRIPFRAASLFSYTSDFPRWTCLSRPNQTNKRTSPSQLPT